ncbi:fibronectin type III domain-containing protein 11-like [Symphorus nematophorus]
MDEVIGASPECVVEEVWTHVDLPDLHNQILQQLKTTLSDHSLMVLQKELQLMQRSSYYLEVQREDPPAAEDEEHQQQQQRNLRLSDSQLWSLIDQQRLQRLMARANTQVKLLLTLLGMLYEEIMRGCQELAAFIIKYDLGRVDIDMGAAMQQRFQQTQKYINDFENRMSDGFGPLDLQTQLIPNAGRFPIPPLRASLFMKLPVMFDRSESYVTSNAVYLSWEVAGQQSNELKEQFEVNVKSLHPNTAEQGPFKCVCLSYHMQVNDLTPDRYYEFSVKRLDAANLVYGVWSDTMILKTLDISK